MKLLSYVTGSVDQELLLRSEYLGRSLFQLGFVARRVSRSGTDFLTIDGVRKEEGRRTGSWFNPRLIPTTSRSGRSKGNPDYSARPAPLTGSVTKSQHEADGRYSTGDALRRSAPSI